MPIAFIVSVGFAAVMLAVVFLRWLSLTGNQGCVWLAKRGILINQMVFFVDGFGMETLSRELLYEEGKHTLVIRYQVQVRRSTVDKELLVPVPEVQVPLVGKTLQEWERCL